MDYPIKADSIVKIDITIDSILIVQIVDTERKNTFSAELCEELQLVVEFVNANTQIKAVIVTGFDSYFMSGGSKEELLLLHEDKLQFTDIPIYRFSLDCSVPVIAAMQGHAIGGGLVMGLFCDFQIMSLESVYTFNFMKYGFTPGMGATYIATRRLGESLATEMLFTAKRYRGKQLKERGAQFQFYPRTQVMDAALEIGREITDMPRNSLVLLKKTLTTETQRCLPDCIENELKLHRMTIHCPEVKTKIVQLFE